MKLFIRAHDLGVKGIQNVTDKLCLHGLDGIQLVAYKVMEDVPYTPDGINEQKAQQIAQTLSSANKQIPLIGAYFNPVHSNKDKVAKITKEQVRKIAETKMKDLNASSIESAMSMIAGTARSMGVTVEE